MSTDLNAPHDPILADSVAQRFTIRAWCRTVRERIAVWEPAPMPVTYHPTAGELHG